MKHIGLFGGTFNPIHLGHLRTAWEVHHGFNLDSTFLIPSALPPHKNLDGIARVSDRVEMVRMAIAGCAGIHISEVELERSGPSYTIDTIRHFKSALFPDAACRLIVGIDAFVEIDTWKSYRDILREIPLIVVMRPGRGKPEWRLLEDFLETKVSNSYQFIETENRFVHDAYQPISIFNATLIGVSSTRIRELIRNDESIRFLVPEEVERYIYSKGLYR